MSFPPWTAAGYEEVIENVKKAAEALEVLREYGFRMSYSDAFNVVYTYEPFNRDIQSPAVTYEPGVGWSYTIEG